jgi:hypothetical protein
MNNRYNILTDINLKLLHQEESKKMYESEFVNEEGDKIKSWDMQTELLAEYMESKGLIALNGEMCHLSNFGEEVSINKGWIKYLESKKKETEKLEIKGTQKETQETIIRKETISEFEYKRYGFYILIVGTLIALLSWLTQGN